MSKLSVVAGVIIRDDGTRKRLLLIQRRDDQKYPGTWCCPGGKVESDDRDLWAALDREINEELCGIHITLSATTQPNFCTETEEAYMHYFVLVPIPARETQHFTYDCRHAQGFGWFSIAEISALSMTPGDDQIRHKLQELLEA